MLPILITPAGTAVLNTTSVLSNHYFRVIYLQHCSKLNANLFFAAACNASDGIFWVSIHSYVPFCAVTRNYWTTVSDKTYAMVCKFHDWDWNRVEQELLDQVDLFNTRLVQQDQFVLKAVKEGLHSINHLTVRHRSNSNAHLY